MPSTLSEQSSPLHTLGVPLTADWLRPRLSTLSTCIRWVRRCPPRPSSKVRRRLNEWSPIVPATLIVEIVDLTGEDPGYPNGPRPELRSALLRLRCCRCLSCSQYCGRTRRGWNRAVLPRRPHRSAPLKGAGTRLAVAPWTSKGPGRGAESTAARSPAALGCETVIGCGFPIALSTVPVSSARSNNRVRTVLSSTPENAWSRLSLSKTPVLHGAPCSRTRGSTCRLVPDETTWREES
jgi:hypothetical protein